MTDCTTNYNINQLAPAQSHPQALTLAPIAFFTKAIAVYRQRQALKKLDATQLTDIGISKKQASWEVSRPFWDLPRN